MMGVTDQMKILRILLIFTILLLVGCSGNNRNYYLERLEELNPTNLTQLNSWIDENEVRLFELFEFVNIRVDLDGNQLDFIGQVLGLDNDYFVSWSFDVVGNTITFTYIWDYARANSEISNYLNENKELLTSIFDVMSLGVLNFSTLSNNELITTFETTAYLYEQLEAKVSTLRVDNVGDVLETFIHEVHGRNMYNLAMSIANETGVESVIIRIIVTFEGDELTNVYFLGR